jgi:hypothetical protein
MQSHSVDPEEYPTRQDVLRAGALAVGLALLGFVTTFALFVKPILKKDALLGVDRGAAERSLPPAYKNSSSGPSHSAVAYSSGGWSSSTKRKSSLEIKEPERELPVAKVVVPKSTPTALPLPENPNQQRTPPKLNRPKPLELSNPQLPERPSEVSLSEAWQRVQGGWMVLGDGLNVRGEGVLIEERLALTSLTAFQASGGRGFLAGQPCSGHLLASDPQLDLALLELDRGVGLPIPLSPESASSGQVLLAADPMRGGQYVEVRSRGVAGAYLGFYGRSAPLGGQPLFNNRGELVALGVAGFDWESQSWNLAVPAAPLANFSKSRVRSTSAPISGAERWAQALSGRVTAQPERSLPTRSNAKVVAGQALGNYPLGLSESQLRQELGSGASLRNYGKVTQMEYSGPQLTFTLVDGLVVAIESNYSFYSFNSCSPESRINLDTVRAQLSDSTLSLLPAKTSLCSAGIEMMIEGDRLVRLRVVAP